MWFALAGVLASLASCHLIGDVGDLRLIEGAGAGGEGQGGDITTSTTTGRGGEGGAPVNCSDEICQEQQTDCQTCSCLEGVVCDCDNLAVDTPCTLPTSAPGRCDGGGSCVQCLSQGHCQANEFCDPTIKTCVPGTCNDQTQNGDETGQDCGGTICGDCPNGQGCLAPGDCLSAYCSNLTCAACPNNESCLPTQYCDGGTCRNKKPIFSGCGADYECQTGNCCTIGFWCCP